MGRGWARGKEVIQAACLCVVFIQTNAGTTSQIASVLAENGGGFGLREIKWETGLYAWALVADMAEPCGSEETLSLSVELHEVF